MTENELETSEALESDIASSEVVKSGAGAVANPENLLVDVELTPALETGEMPQVANDYNQALKEEIHIDDADLLKLFESIPDKMAFKIGEVADLVGVKQYVLRFWESEFEALKPKKSAHNQRMYSRRDVETTFLIKKLLYSDRFSIEGARKAIKNLRSQIKEDKKAKEISNHFESGMESLSEIRADIKRLRTLFL